MVYNDLIFVFYIVLVNAINIDGATVQEFADTVKETIKNVLSITDSLDKELFDFQLSLPIVFGSLSFIQVFVNFYFLWKLRRMNLQHTTPVRKLGSEHRVIDIDDDAELSSLKTDIDNMQRQLVIDLKNINVKLEIIHLYISDQAEMDNILW